MFPLPILCSPVTHKATQALSHLPLPPNIGAPNHPNNMDGFYDQQVPFMVPPSVSGHVPALNITSSHSNHGSSSWKDLLVVTVDHVHLFVFIVHFTYHLHWPLGGKWHLLSMSGLSWHVFIFFLPTAQVSCRGTISQQASERQEKEICRHRTRPGYRRYDADVNEQSKCICIPVITVFKHVTGATMKSGTSTQYLSHLDLQNSSKTSVSCKRSGLQKVSCSPLILWQNPLEVSSGSLPLGIKWLSPPSVKTMQWIYSVFVKVTHLFCNVEGTPLISWSLFLNG